MSFFTEVKFYEVIDDLAPERPCNDDSDVVAIKEDIRTWVINKIKELREEIKKGIIASKTNITHTYYSGNLQAIIDFLMKEFNVKESDLK